MLYFECKKMCPSLKEFVQHHTWRETPSGHNQNWWKVEAQIRQTLEESLGFGAGENGKDSLIGEGGIEVLIDIFGLAVASWKR